MQDFLVHGSEHFNQWMMTMVSCYNLYSKSFSSDRNTGVNSELQFSSPPKVGSAQEEGTVQKSIETGPQICRQRWNSEADNLRSCRTRQILRASRRDGLSKTGFASTRIRGPVALKKKRHCAIWRQPFLTFIFCWIEVHRRREPWDLLAIMEEGYRRLAVLMSRNPEMAIFRSFKTLNVQNILYLQAELNELETISEKLHQYDRASSHPKRRSNHKNWYYLSHSKMDGNDEQWQNALDIRAKLHEYSKFEFILKKLIEEKSGRVLLITYQLQMKVCPNISCCASRTDLQRLIWNSSVNGWKTKTLETFRWAGMIEVYGRMKLQVATLLPPRKIIRAMCFPGSSSISFFLSSTTALGDTSK